MAALPAVDGPFLTDLSPKDKPWDKAKRQSREIQSIYAQAAEFERYAQRMDNCSGYLDFAQEIDKETGEVKYKLRKAQFCRVRYCSVCQGRRALYWIAKFHQALPTLIEEHPKGKFLYLVLTVKNCPVSSLRDMLREMNAAWNRMRTRPVFQHVVGWIRTTEITRGKDGSAHPHFNVLLFVSPSYFAGRNYLSQDKWAAMWKSCARLDYDPMVWISATKKKRKRGAPASEENDLEGSAIGGAKEVMKYSVKPADMVKDPQWFFELTRQTHHLRFLAAGGCFKDAFKQDVTEEDMIQIGEDVQPSEADQELSRFLWSDSVKRYYYARQIPAKVDQEMVKQVEALSRLDKLARSPD